MHVYFVVILAVLALVVRNNVVSARIQTSQGRLGPSTAANKEFVSPRVLRQGETYEGNEERGITDIAKKLGKKLQALDQGTKIAIYVRYQSMFTDTGKTVQKFFKKNLTPDEVYHYLKLYKNKNRWAGRGMDKDWSPELMLWKEYRNAWARKNPRWETKVDLSWLSDPKRFFAE